MFFDTNIIVYSFVPSAPFHDQAKEVLANCVSNGDSISISRQVIREIIATLTRPQTYSLPLPIVDVVQAIESIQSKVDVLEDGSKVTQILLDLLQKIPCGGKQVHDANIVATMLAYGIGKLVTHNTADFSRFGHLIEIVPLAS